jgi:hypothetical protein
VRVVLTTPGTLIATQDKTGLIIYGFVLLTSSVCRFAHLRYHHTARVSIVASSVHLPTFSFSEDMGFINDIVHACEMEPAPQLRSNSAGRVSLSHSSARNLLFGVQLQRGAFDDLELGTLPAPVTTYVGATATGLTGERATTEMLSGEKDVTSVSAMFASIATHDRTCTPRENPLKCKRYSSISRLLQSLQSLISAQLV